jgi:hypothetical protein
MGRSHHDWQGRLEGAQKSGGRYRAMKQETTDLLAARLLHDIILDLEAELEGSLKNAPLDAA